MEVSTPVRARLFRSAARGEGGGGVFTGFEILHPTHADDEAVVMNGAPGNSVVPPFGYARGFTPAFGRAEPAHRAKGCAMRGAPGAV